MTLLTSPLADVLRSRPGTRQELNQMSVLTQVPDPKPAETLGLADLSYLTRFGVKGPQSASWLSAQSIPIPEQPNTWAALPEGGLIARLGRSEFLIEDGPDSQTVPRLAAACNSPPAQVYPVLRQDAAIALCGQATQNLLRQTCSFNFQSLNLTEHPVILTTMVGVTVTVIPQPKSHHPIYRIWCDNTFAPYLWQTLAEITTELGGTIIGTQDFIPYTGQMP
ncbi:hypothetical protein [Vasconcelosia minhoensis]|nr:hypothetical protein [Romeria gracilis]